MVWKLGGGLGTQIIYCLKKDSAGWLGPLLEKAASCVIDFVNYDAVFKHEDWQVSYIRVTWGWW